MKVLVIDDTQKHLDAAVKTLEGHDVTLCSSYDKALQLLEKKAVDENGELCWAGSESATQLPYWDAVLCDLLMPAGKDAMGAKGDQYIGQEMPVGWSLALVAARRGARYIGVLSDTNHHDHPASAMLDRLDNENCDPHIFIIDGVKVLMTNHIHYFEFEDKEEEEVECHRCNGRGNLYRQGCFYCNGSGVYFKVGDVRAGVALAYKSLVENGSVKVGEKCRCGVLCESCGGAKNTTRRTGKHWGKLLDRLINAK